MNTAAKIKMVSDLIGHVNTNYNTDEILSVFKNLADLYSRGFYSISTGVLWWKG